MDADLLAALRALPQRPTETWQGGPTRLPKWIEAADGGAKRRAWAPLFVSAQRASKPPAAAEMPGRDGLTTEAVLAALVEFAKSFRPAGYRPAALRTSDSAFAREAAPFLEQAGISVRCDPRLPLVETELKRYVAESYVNERPAMMGAKGMTVERVRAFAEAACAFDAANPFRLFEGPDVVAAATTAEPAPRAVHIAAAGDPSHGLRVLLGGMEDADMDILLYDPSDPCDASFADHDLWEDARLPALADGRLPLLVCERPDGRLRGPSTKELAYAEAVLRAFVDVGAADLDSGRFERKVATADGPTTATFEVPSVSEAPPVDAAVSPLENALAAHGRTKLARLRAILERRPEDPEALLHLATSVYDDAVSSGLLRRAAASMEKRIGAPRLKALENSGRAGEDDDGDVLVNIYDVLGQTLTEKAPDDAEAAYLRALALDAGDYGRVKHRLAALRLVRGRDADAAALTADAKPSDTFALTSSALVAFRAGDRKRADDLLRGAFGANRNLTSTLFGDGVPMSPDYDFGDEDEAEWVGGHLYPAFAATPGALDWAFELADEADAALDDEE
jgi:hypothetical protein